MTDLPTYRESVTRALEHARNAGPQDPYDQIDPGTTAVVEAILALTHATLAVAADSATHCQNCCQR